MKRWNPLAAGMAVAVALALTPLAPALAGGGVKIGVLHCKNIPGTRTTLIIRSVPIRL